MEIDRSSPLPLYFQLKTRILDLIKDQNLKPGDKIPSAEELQKQFSLSSTTVRMALKELEQEGIVIRQAGRGTFISRPIILEGPGEYQKDYVELHDPKLKLKWQVMVQEVIPFPPSLRSTMQVQNGDHCFHLRRARLVNDQIIGYADSYIHKDTMDKIDTKSIETGGSMKYLTPLNLERCHAERILEAKNADHESVSILGIRPEQAVLVLTRTLKDENHRPLEYFRAVFVGTQYQYHIRGLPVQI